MTTVMRERRVSGRTIDRERPHLGRPPNVVEHYRALTYIHLAQEKKKKTYDKKHSKKKKKKKNKKKKKKTKKNAKKNKKATLGTEAQRRRSYITARSSRKLLEHDLEGPIGTPKGPEHDNHDRATKTVKTSTGR